MKEFLQIRLWSYLVRVMQGAVLPFSHQAARPRDGFETAALFHLTEVLNRLAWEQMNLADPCPWAADSRTVVARAAESAPFRCYLALALRLAANNPPMPAAVGGINDLLLMADQMDCLHPGWFDHFDRHQNRGDSWWLDVFDPALPRVWRALLSSMRKVNDRGSETGFVDAGGNWVDVSTTRKTIDLSSMTVEEARIVTAIARRLHRRPNLDA